MALHYLRVDLFPLALLYIQFSRVSHIWPPHIENYNTLFQFRFFYSKIMELTVSGSPSCMCLISGIVPWTVSDFPDISLSLSLHILSSPLQISILFMLSTPSVYGVLVTWLNVLRFSYVCFSSLYYIWFFPIFLGLPHFRHITNYHFCSF